MAERFLPTEDPVLEQVLTWTVERDARDVRSQLGRVQHLRALLFLDAVPELGDHVCHEPLVPARRKAVWPARPAWRRGCSGWRRCRWLRPPARIACRPRGPDKVLLL